MISGARMIIYSSNAEADRGFFCDVLGFPWVDAGHGWLIFALPPTEIAVHPAEENCMSADLAATIQTLEKHKVQCDLVTDQGWGLLTHLCLPGGGKLGLYQPKHKLAAAKDGAKTLATSD